MKHLNASPNSLRFRTGSVLKSFAAAVAAAALLGAAGSARAQSYNGNWTNTFDTASGTASWCYWYDMMQHITNTATGSTFGYNAPITNSWDSSMNSTLGPPPVGGVGSGALHWVIPWPGIPENSGDGGQNLVYGTFAGDSQYDTGKNIDASTYDFVTFDLYVNPSSPLDSAGNFCNLTVLFFMNNYSTFTISNVTVGPSNSGKWVRYTCPINDALAPSVDDGRLAAGFGFNLNSYGGENANLFTNTVPTEMWVDNIYVHQTTAPSPPPTMLAPAINTLEPGLNCFVQNCFNDEYQRNEVELIANTGLGFLNNQTVTYSFTVAHFPAVAYDSFQAHLFITQNGASADTASSLDYNDTNLIWLNVSRNADGSGTGILRVKVNEQSSNSNLFGTNFTSINGASGLTSYAGTLASLGAATPEGTWGLTFNNETNVTIFGPGGVSTNITILEAEVTNFVDPLNVVIGAQPNNTNNTYNGQKVVYANFTITNATSSSLLFNDNFLTDQTLDTTSTWRILAGEANTVLLFANDPAQVVVSWHRPAHGWGLQVSPSMNSPITWKTLSGPDSALAPPPYAAGTVVLMPGITSVVVPGGDLPSTNQCFFRLNQQAYTQLQVLLPGESNAPGTPTGKTGSPTPQSLANGTFVVTINACDANWTVLSTITDNITLTSSDSTSGSNGSITTLAAGTGQAAFGFGQTGTFTIMATDTSVQPTRNITATSSSVQSTP